MKPVIANLITAGIVFASAGVGALGVWVIINWIPNVTILVGAVAAGYIAYTKIKG
jgi:hypothetical protein